MRSNFFRAIFLALALLPATSGLAQTYKINAGGTAVSPFSADVKFGGGSTTYSTTEPITGNGSYPMSIYQTERSGNFTYTLDGFPANAPCELRLHFAEIYWAETGKRLFSVDLNGKAILSGYDIVAKAGGKNKAIVETFLANANASGQLLLSFNTEVDNAKISAIEAKVLFTGPYTAKTKIQSGMGAAGAVGPYLNGKLPSLNPTQSSASGGWDVVNAFPGLAGQLPNVMSIYAIPNTTPQKLIARLRGGQMKIFDENPAATTTETFMDIADRINLGNNGGLSAFCFHPQFNVAGSPNKDFVYVYYQTIQNTLMYNRLSRFTRNPVTGKIDNSTELVMIQTKDVVIFDHTGGAMIFDNQGYLILMYGDLEWTDEEYAQCLSLDTMFQSSIIRIDVDMKPTNLKPTRTLQGGIVNGVSTTKSLNTGKYAGAGNFSGIGYHIPIDNPYNDNPTALKEHYGKGVRNPWNISKDPVTGDILFFDAGSNMGDKWEEVNLLKPKADYGWPYWEGPISKTFETGIAAPVPIVYNSPTPINTPMGVFTQDVASYNHANGNGNAMGDGDVYQGDLLPGLKGKLIYCDFTSGRFWAKDYKTPGSEPTIIMDIDGGISGVKSSPNKQNLYIVNYNLGIIYKMVSVGLPNPQPPTLLSQTGAFTDLNTLTPSPGLIPYEPASPLWSDNAAKHRWMAIPNDGTHNTTAEKIVFSANGEWSFPVGTVFVKHFELPANAASPNSVVRLETRFLVHGADGYFAFSYKWNTEGTEAFLQNNASTATIPVTQTGGAVTNQVWEFPSQSACMDCHQQAAGRVLGAKTLALNWQYPYASQGTQNQITYLNSKAIFTESLNLTLLPTYITAKGLKDTSASVETRVRSFIDMNCSSCHRPGGTAGRAVFDARLTTPLELAGLINATPSADTLGLVNAKLIKPGDAANSVFAVRDASRNPSIQMPPLGTTIAHPEYIPMLNTWINGLTSTIADADGDGVPDAQDAFPNNPLEWADTDGDGVGNNSDLFPTDPTEWADANGDGVGDNTVLGPVQNLLSINAGGVAAGTFSGDAYFTGGGTYTSTAPISGMPTGVPDTVYKTERNKNFTYTITGLDPASYHRIDLHFAEVFWTAPAKRLFDVTLNGKLVLNDFDVFAAAGAVNKVVVKSFVTKPDSTGKITAVFTSVLDEAKLSAIVIGKHLGSGGSTNLDTDGDGVPDATDAFPNDPAEWADANGDGVGDNTVLGALQPVIAVNSGGTAVGTFVADTGFIGGGVYSTTAAITDAATNVPSSVYQSERNQTFSYTFSGLNPAQYHRVELHFAEIFWTAPGKRLFDVNVNGKVVLNDFDIFAAAGSINKAVMKAVLLKPDAAGKITLDFVTVLDQAKVSAIVLGKHLGNVIGPDSDNDGVPDSQDAFPNNPLESKDTDGDSFGDNSDAFPNDPTEWADANKDGVGDNTVLGYLQPLLAWNAGGPITGTFLADANFSGGGTYSSTVAVTGAATGIPAAIYQTERNGNFTYTFTGLDPAAFHRFDLHFAEIYWTAPGKRLFDVIVNGKVALDDFDVFAAAGGINKAFVKGYVSKPTSSGTVTIQFITVVDQAKLSGITIGKHLNSPNPPPPLDSDGDGVPDAQDAFPNNPAESKDTDGDGIGDNSDPFPNDPLNGATPVQLIVNGSFEDTNPKPTTFLKLTAGTQVPGWATNKSTKTLEVWKSGYLSFPAQQGVQLVEMDGGSLEQILTTTPGATLTWTFYHRGRGGNDTVALDLGPATGTLTRIKTFTTGKAAWVKYEGTYVVPAGQTKTKFMLVPISGAAGLTSANLIDNVSVLQAPLAPAPIAKAAAALAITTAAPLDSDGDGVVDRLDAFPNDPGESKNSDGDGRGDNTDLFPTDRTKTGAGKYTLLLPLPSSVTGIGDGYGTLTLDAALKGRLVLNMGDGTQFAQNVTAVNRTLTINATGTAPHAADTLQGTLTWSPQPRISDFNGTLTWTIAGKATPITLQAIGSFYTPATLQKLLGKTKVTVDLMGNPTDFQRSAVVTRNTVKWSLSTASGSFNQSNGLLIWKVKSPTGKTLTLKAAYFDDQKLLGGFFTDGIREVGAAQIVPAK
ncbi:MAG: Glucose/arabinose dehydrogenase, beta-propeller fold [Verrucomicrobia bacterium]|nr:MAG: Glucose/arabinose dehydrogenase, beta-propeller fold [Verrucomicrobiota bacterium]